eukprot:GGOE01023319.1.p1 GENE.GGOE01023319.1~~GGOE01023319.1.p1  ORF type:complete len:168 (-),score=12.04 GGOE01023319.1:286-789(-)
MLLQTSSSVFGVLQSLPPVLTHPSPLEPKQSNTTPSLSPHHPPQERTSTRSAHHDARKEVCSMCVRSSPPTAWPSSWQQPAPCLTPASPWDAREMALTVLIISSFLVAFAPAVWASGHQTIIRKPQGLRRSPQRGSNALRLPTPERHAAATGQRPCAQNTLHQIHPN